ncbi:MAG: energy-coupling factor ABC transporter substrate-binding protein [Fusobacterium perfoetens]|uniref:energy-coupling factor ABC transporter substrate-binding protein n=1 Tax=Fusobacterium perfoetens TaxID=852 RepID=UPI0023F24BDC|nr:energy-coupling factor ABC transporter substrate-binding protein [Fusobacterium perfoetens]MCI6152796.1 energy-coupling factor ABC transporter substrate-binding protein [Fusobacterium perfoetens]MDY3236690.1 energy-coupling factor ABC transporter substrate-binding protein [Fusobacterium perfoetens]
MKKDKKIVVTLLIIVILTVFTPLFVLKDAEFGGSDNAGSTMIENINKDYEPWFTPILEKVIGGELPGEVESLFFCLQTAIGVGIIAFYMGRMYERKRLGKEEEDL